MGRNKPKRSATCPRPNGPPASSPAAVADQTGGLLAEREHEWLERLTTDPASFAAVEREVHEQARRQADLDVAGLLAKANEAPRPEAEVSGGPPRGGRFRAVAPLGGGHVGKAPLGPTWLLEVELSLTTLQLLLLADVLTHPGLVQAHRADAGSRRPEVQPGQPTLLQQLPMNTTALLPFRKPIVYATLDLGGMLRHRGTWSGIACPSTNSIPR